MKIGLIVEGPTEKSVFEKILKKMGIIPE